MEDIKLNSAEKALLKFETKFYMEEDNMTKEKAEEMAMDKIMRVRKVKEDLKKEGFTH